MHTVSKSLSTNHSPEVIWEALAAFNEVHVWHPLVDTSPGTPREQFGIGAARVCHFHDGTSVDEKVIAFVPGRSIDIQLSDFSMPLKEANARLELTPQTQGTSLTMTLNFTPKFGPLGAIMATLMMKPMMGNMLNKVLAGLDEHLTAPAIAA